MPEDEEVLATALQRVGSVLHGKYHIDGVLGIGGMATVYAATHRNRKRFAIKLLHPEYAVRSDVRARFVREGYVANSVNHSGVVSILDDDADETGAPFLVMELLEGVSVDALYAIKREPVPVREALGIAHQLLEVLEAAHSNDIIHRDIKPANLFLQRDGQVKVLDFGIARLRDANQGLKSTKTGATLGTPAFMAPEQAMAVPGEVDVRSDIWGAGATLFTLLSAHFVHEADNARQIMIRVATEPARSLVSVLPDAPGAVVDLVARALRFEKSERWGTAAEMRHALVDVHRALFGEPDRSHLAALVDRVAATVSSAPTEISPKEAEAPSDIPTRREPAGVTRAVIPGDRGVATTTATPLSTGSRSGRAGSVSKLALLGGVVALAAIAVVAVFSSGTKQHETPAVPGVTATTAGAPAAADLARVSSEGSARAADVSAAPASAASSVPWVASPMPRRPADARPNEKTASAPVAAARRPAQPTPITKPSATEISPPAPSTKSNPLQLQLQ
jgi:eukaryotic-like serine/threonine-protein kinase